MRHGLLAAALLCLTATAAQAALLGRAPVTSGGTDFQAYYDTVLNVTWLADANLQMTNSFGLTRNGGIVPANGEIGSTGWMSWSTAKIWIAGMNADGATGYLGFDDWRLPTLRPTSGGAFDTTWSNNGTTDLGYGATGIGWQSPVGNASEMGYMYYANQGNRGRAIPNFGGTSTAYAEQSGWGLVTAGPFINLQPGSNYWFATEFNSNEAWAFHFHDGSQGINSKPAFNFVWAVRAGDIASVPIPAAIWLFGGALGALGILKRRATA